MTNVPFVEVWFDDEDLRSMLDGLLHKEVSQSELEIIKKHIDVDYLTCLMQDVGEEYIRAVAIDCVCVKEKGC